MEFHYLCCVLDTKRIKAEHKATVVVFFEGNPNSLTDERRQFDISFELVSRAAGESFAFWKNLHSEFC